MIDLHLHLDGSLNVKNIHKMFEMSGLDMSFSEEEIMKLLTARQDCTNLGEYLEKFDLPLKLLQTRQCIQFAVYELVRDLHEQGLCYAEIRFAPQLHLQKGLTQEEVVKAAIKGRDCAMKDFGMKTNLILCCMRNDSNEAQNIETVDSAKKYLGKGVCAVDLAGNESAYPTEIFENVFNYARDNNVPIIMHAGEAAGPESVRQALKLGAVRIGHGIHSVEDDELMDELKEKNIFLEMCFTSNMQTKTVSDVRDYPIEVFINKGLLVTLNTDNMTVSNTTLRNEYKLIKNYFNLENKELKTLALNSVDASFLSIGEKNELRKKVEAGFDLWINL